MILFMKAFKKSLIGILVMVMAWGIPVMAAPRVISEVQVLSDHSAVIKLTWSDQVTKTPITITTWRFTESHTLEVFYILENKEGENWDERLISHPTYTFPMKVFVTHEGRGQLQLADIEPGQKAYGAIMNLYHRGIINGYPDGNFRPMNPVTRAEFSKMLLMTAGYALDTTTPSNFSDVSQDHWFRSFVMTLAARGIIEGKGNHIFDPQGHITIGQMLTILSRTFRTYETNNPYAYSLSNHWSNAYFLDVVNQGLVQPQDLYYNPYTPDKKATREDCAVLLSRVLEQLHDVTR
ncbi:S-layer homology domain-containing protein [Petrocella sp. FN5]|uniref:S-layer homology domain-containing protein n=1 Tax=Petrocella sp. FN5 TaxID=3032002 RepID=UPI0023DB0FDD|nr:S-layer homology domain-containing protein [Petrocella sp. FN5]MDF1617127.1 S-layer homology domain-containing protein [Petrocella sp. FN5]